MASRPPEPGRSFAATAAMIAAVSFVALPALAQREFREFPSFEGASAAAPLPSDWDIPGELVIGRLMYPPAAGGFRFGDWRQGNASWTDDYPKGDRKLIEMIRRFTRTNVRGVEQPVNLEDGNDVDYWPFMVMGTASPWALTDEMAANLRQYLLKGGFLFVDSFFGTNSWVVFLESLNLVFPDRPVIDLTGEEPIFHIIFDLPEMIDTQIPHVSQAMRGRGSFGGPDTAIPHWRGVFDDDGRLMILIAHNNDVADAWQWADDPRYPADKANLALRMGVNVVMYAMTH